METQDAQPTLHIEGEYPEQIPSDYLQIVQKDILTSYQFKPGTFAYSLASNLSGKALFSLGNFLSRMDDLVSRVPIGEAARTALQQLTRGILLHRQPSTPSSGPILLIANHPGFVDSITALAGTQRKDVSLLAGRHATLEALPHLRKHMIFVNQRGANDRASALRRSIEHLKSGGVLIVFPRGMLEPDPALIPGAYKSLDQWNDSTGIYLKKVPETTVQPLLISQMVHPAALSSPLVKLFKETRRKQQIAQALAFALSLRKKTGDYWKVQPRLDFGQPIKAEDLSPKLDPRELANNIREQMKLLLTSVYPLPNEA